MDKLISLYSTKYDTVCSNHRNRADGKWYQDTIFDKSFDKRKE